MKNVQLMTEAEARRTIEDLGLTVGNVRRAYSDSVEEGKVISQSVAQDAEVRKGDRVDLVVSRGRETRNPNTQPAPTTRPPVSQTTAAPVTQPSVTEPPVTQPPQTTAAPTEPPTTAPPPTTAAPTTAAPTTSADPAGIPTFAPYIPMG